MAITTPVEELHKVFYSLLEQNTDLIAITNSGGTKALVFDTNGIPDERKPPYVVIRSVTVSRRDSKGRRGFNAVVILDSWSKRANKSEIISMHKAIYHLLDDGEDSITALLENYHCYNSQFWGNDQIEDTTVNPRLQHGVEEYHLMLEEI